MIQRWWISYFIIFFIQNVYSCDPLCKDLNMSISDNSNMCSCSKNAQTPFVEKPKLKINSFQNGKRSYLIHKAFQGTIRVPSGYHQGTIVIFAWRVTWNYSGLDFHDVWTCFWLNPKLKTCVKIKNVTICPRNLCNISTECTGIKYTSFDS